MTPNFLKCLHQVTSFSKRRLGDYRYPIYRVQKTILIPADFVKGIASEFTETLVEISGDIAPYVAKRYGSVTENAAAFILTTNIKLSVDNDDDSQNDEIKYNDVRYRLADIRHYDRLAFDDFFTYLLIRKHDQGGGP